MHAVYLQQWYKHTTQTHTHLHARPNKMCAEWKKKSVEKIICTRIFEIRVYVKKRGERTATKPNRASSKLLNWSIHTWKINCAVVWRWKNKNARSNLFNGFIFERKKTRLSNKVLFLHGQKIWYTSFFRFDRYHRHHQQQMLISEHDRRVKKTVTHDRNTDELMRDCGSDFRSRGWSRIVEYNSDIGSDLILRIDNLVLPADEYDHTFLPILAPFINLSRKKPSSIRRFPQLKENTYSSMTLSFRANQTEFQAVRFSWILSL